MWDVFLYSIFAERAYSCAFYMHCTIHTMLSAQHSVNCLEKLKENLFSSLLTSSSLAKVMTNLRDICLCLPRTLSLTSCLHK